MTSASLPDQIKASVFVGTGRPLELRMFPRPQLATGETLVQIVCSTICGSDLHTYFGKRHSPAPSVLGHEALGRIVAFGPGEPSSDIAGQPLQIGDRVSWCVAASCGACFFCRHDLPQKCEQLFKYGHESCNGRYPLSGGLAEYCQLVRGTAILRVPAEVPDAVASSANCATATVAASIRSAGGCGGKTVLVQGAGLLGLTTAAMACADGAEHVIVADIDARRLALAERFGASATVNIAEDAARLEHHVREATHGRGADVAFEMSGADDAFQQGLPLVRTGGVYVLVGAVRPVGAALLNVEQVVRRMWTIRGVHNYEPADLAAAIEFLAKSHRRFQFAELVSGFFSLQDADLAFHDMAATGAIRVAVRPDLSASEGKALRAAVPK